MEKAGADANAKKVDVEGVAAQTRARTSAAKEVFAEEVNVEKAGADATAKKVDVCCSDPHSYLCCKGGLC